MLGRVNGERRHQQTLRQTSADAVDETRCPPAASDSNTHARRHAPAAVRAMVSWPGERQFTRRPSSRRSVNTPQIVMLSESERHDGSALETGSCGQVSEIVGGVRTSPLCALPDDDCDWPMWRTGLGQQL